MKFAFIKSIVRGGINKLHVYHLLKPSLWPILVSGAIFNLIVSLIFVVYTGNLMDIFDTGGSIFTYKIIGHQCYWYKDFLGINNTATLLGVKEFLLSQTHIDIYSTQLIYFIFFIIFVNFLTIIISLVLWRFDDINFFEKNKLNVRFYTLSKVRKHFFLCFFIFSILLIQLVLFFLFLHLCACESLLNKEVLFYIFNSEVGFIFTKQIYLLQLIPVIILILFLLSVLSFNEQLSVYKTFTIGFGEIILLSIINFSVICLFLSADMLTFFVFIDIISMVFYILAVTKTNRGEKIIVPTRSSINYIIFGILGSCFMLLGVFVIYLLLGSINFKALSSFIPSFYSTSSSLYVNFLILGFSLVLLNLFFKIGSFPFYFWVKPVYCSIDNCIFLFLSIFSKPLFSILFLFKFYFFFTTDYDLIFYLLIFVGLCSMIVGCYSAFGQDNIKAIIASSSILNAGVFLVILGLTGDIFYAILFIFNYSISLYFFLINAMKYRYARDVSRVVWSVRMLRYSTGHNISSDIWYIGSIFSLIGNPPLIGFFVKFYFLSEISIFRNSVFFFLTFFIMSLILIIFSYNYLKIINSIVAGWGNIYRSGPILIVVLKKKANFFKIMRLLQFSYSFVLPIILLILLF